VLQGAARQLYRLSYDLDANGKLAGTALGRAWQGSRGGGHGRAVGMAGRRAGRVAPTALLPPFQSLRTQPTQQRPPQAVNLHKSPPCWHLRSAGILQVQVVDPTTGSRHQLELLEPDEMRFSAKELFHLRCEEAVYRALPRCSPQPDGMPGTSLSSGAGTRLDAATLGLLRCPLSRHFMRDPVLAADGVTYDRPAIQGAQGWGGVTCGAMAGGHAGDRRGVMGRGWSGPKRCSAIHWGAAE